VKFVHDQGGRRDPLAVLGDIKQKYDLLKTDQEKEGFMGQAFKGADLDTIKGLQALMKGDMLQKIAEMNRKIGEGGGTIKKDLADGINNAIDQTGRLKNALRQAADGFIQPINDGISRAIKKILDAKKDGGLEMSGKEIAAAGFTALGIGYTGYKLAGPALKKFLGKLGGTGLGIAEGKAVEAATGVTPVFVTNWPVGGLPVNSPGNDAITKNSKLSTILKKGAALSGIFSIVGGGAFLAKEYLERGGSATNLGASLHGMPEMYSAADIEAMADRIQVKNEINVRIDKDSRVWAENKSSNSDVKVKLYRGDFFSH